MLLREADHRRLLRGAVRPRVDVRHPLLARRLQLAEACIGRPEIVIGRDQVGLGDLTVASEPPLLCGSAGTQLAIVTL